MLHVLFILLKILGILLLLLVGVLLLVLLAPLRYSFKLEKEEQGFVLEFSGKGYPWLCWLFSLRPATLEKVFDYRIRILGHQIAGNQKEFLEKQKKKAEKAQEKRRKEKENRKKESQKKEKNCLLQYRKRKSL